MEPGRTEMRDGQKHFEVLENNPEVMNLLAAKLGLSDELAFYDVYSLDEPELLTHIPRPVLALLVIIPFTAAWDRDRCAEDADRPAVYPGAGPEEPVIWFKQTIGHACGSIGLLHCAINGPTARFITPGSLFDEIRTAALPLKMAERAQMLYDSEGFEHAHQSVARMGDSSPQTIDEGSRMGQHFVAFVRGNDGHLWELEGSRRGPLDRGLLGDEDDLLSSAALDLGLRRLIRLERDAGGKDLRFSCIALARKDA
ncbi:cysteine proteinase [Thozetella sp. PMI_491]|nr:cysteine proteinase [Thozetella sp. PMI_491]